ncbi:MAG: tetratricopeptide repeat protein [Rhodopirellula sp.]|nr:tetratricopeptide repeat protein [Rhodopirellula sp.]
MLRRNLRKSSAVVSLRTSIVLLVVALLQPTLAFADAGLDAYNFARGLYKAERWLQAEEAFREFQTEFPKHEQIPFGTLYLGLSQIQLEKHADGRQTLESFIQKYPQNSDVAHAKYRVAECSYYLGELERAEKDFNSCLKDYPKDPFREFALFYLGDAQRRLGKSQEAVASLQSSLSLFPQGRMAAEARFGLAQATEATGDTAKALTLYREAAKGAPEQRGDAAQLALANLLFSQKQFIEAVTEYEALGVRFPESKLVSVATLNAGFALYQISDFSKALARFDAAEVDPKQSVTAGYWKGLTLKALKDFSGAAEVLTDVEKKAGDMPLAESVVYQLADCQFRSGQLAQAEASFLKVTQKWPMGQFADHSLYFATECILEAVRQMEPASRADRLKEAELLLSKFERDYETSSIRLSHKLQQGQFLMLRATPEDMKQAAEIYAAVLSSTQREQTQAEARYQLARVRQEQGDRQGALDAIAPLAEAVMKNPRVGLPESLILFAYLSLEAGQPANAIRSANSYLQNNPSGPLRDQAWSHVANASAAARDWTVVDKAIASLLKDHAESPIVSRTILNVAETAYQAEHWQVAGRFFETLLPPGPESPFHAAALSGLAWTELKKKDYTSAAQHFQQFVNEHSQHELAAEAAFMVGDALQQASKPKEAAVAFEAAYKKFAPHEQAFLAGLQAARIQARLKQTDEANRIYADVEGQFSKRPEHDQLLNEWALVLYEAERYHEADELFRRLTNEHPDSSVADNARFSLAESDLVNGKVKFARTAFAALATDEKADAAVQEDSLFRVIGIDADSGEWKNVVDSADDFEKRFAKSQYTPDVRFYLGNAQLNLGEVAAAEKTLEALSQQVSDPEVGQSDWVGHLWALLAECQVRQKKYDAVLATAEKARAWKADSPTRYLLDEVVGRAWKNQAKFTEATAAFTRVIESEAGSRTETAAKAQLMIAEIHFLQKQYTDARDGYLKVYFLYKFPEWQAPALFQAGQCEELLGTKEGRDGAVKWYQTLQKEFGDTDFAKRAAERLKVLGSTS